MISVCSSTAIVRAKTLQVGFRIRLKNETGARTDIPHLGQAIRERYPLWHFREKFLREIGPENYAAYAEGYRQMSDEQDEESFSDDEDEGMGGLS